MSPKRHHIHFVCEEGRTNLGVMALLVVNGGYVAIHDHDAWHVRGGRTGKLRGARLEFLPTTAPLIMLLARATTPEPFAADSHTYTSKASSEGTAPAHSRAARFFL